MGGTYSRKMLSKREVIARAHAADPRMSHVDLSNTAPSALARILLTSESSYLDQLAGEADADDVQGTMNLGKGAKGKAVASTPTSAASSPAAAPKKAAAAPSAPAASAAVPAAAPAPATAPPAPASSSVTAPNATISSSASTSAAAPQPGHGVLHSRTMDEDWFRNVHHSILSSGGDLRTSALSLFLPPTLENMESPTAETAASAAAAAAANVSAGMSGSPKDSGIDDMSSRTSPHDSPERVERRSSEHPPSERRIQRESSGLSSQGNRFYNSCWTIYVDSTVVKPNLESTLRCTAYVIVLEMEANHRQGRTTNPPQYESLQKPLDSNLPPVRTLPAIPKMEEVFTFLARIFKAAQLKADSAVILLIYLHRMLNNTKVAMTSANWKRIVVGGLIMSSKVWEDQAIWNVDFCTLFPQMRVSEFNDLERMYLTAMQFQVNVKASLYTKCYFLLRDVADLMKTPLTLQPLSADEARKLELRMVQYRERIEREYGDVSDRISGDAVQGFDLRRVKSDNIYVAKAGSSNAFVM